MKKKPAEKVLPKIQKATRDNARTPVQWSADAHAGFSTAEPWFPVNPNYTEVNAASQENDPDSLLNFYRALIAFRGRSELVRFGDYEDLAPAHPHLYIYKRSCKGENLLVLCSFTEKPCHFRLPEDLSAKIADVCSGGAMAGGMAPEIIFNNYPCDIAEKEFTTRPYETRVFRWNT